MAGVLVVRGLSGGDDLPEVGRLELVGLGEGRDGGLQEVALGRGRTLGLGCWMLVVVPPWTFLFEASQADPCEARSALMALPLFHPRSPQQCHTICNSAQRCISPCF